jgi:hypothetical protein
MVSRFDMSSGAASGGANVICNATANTPCGPQGLCDEPRTPAYWNPNAPNAGNGFLVVWPWNENLASFQWEDQGLLTQFNFTAPTACKPVYEPNVEGLAKYQTGGAILGLRWGSIALGAVFASLAAISAYFAYISKLIHYPQGSRRNQTNRRQRASTRRSVMRRAQPVAHSPPPADSTSASLLLRQRSPG